MKNGLTWGGFMLMLLAGMLAPARLSAQQVAIPFERDSGAIVLNVRLNNSPRVLRFLFDTGADGLAIRRSLADSMGIAATRSQEVSFVGGRSTIGIASGIALHLTDNFSLTDQNAALFATVKNGLDGIVGLNIGALHVVSVNFDNNRIVLTPFDQYTPPARSHVVPLCSRTKLVCLPAALDIAGKGAVQGEFIFDTGATSYFLIAFSPFVRKNRLLLSGFKPERELSTVSMGHATPTFEGKAHSFRMADSIGYNNMPVTLQAGSSKGANPNAPDGSIGIRLIQNFNFDVNLQRREIALRQREHNS